MIQSNRTTLVVIGIHYVAKCHLMKGYPTNRTLGILYLGPGRI